MCSYPAKKPTGLKHLRALNQIAVAGVMHKNLSHMYSIDITQRHRIYVEALSRLEKRNQHLCPLLADIYLEEIGKPVMYNINENKALILDCLYFLDEYNLFLPYPAKTWDLVDFTYPSRVLQLSDSTRLDVYGLRKAILEFCIEMTKP